MANLDTQLEALWLVLLAVVLGGIIGWEREHERKPAGLRTHMLVCGAAALFTVLGEIMTRFYYLRFPDEVLNSDPIRVIQAVAVGVSFIGAGTIIQNRGEERVKNLTTAASILFVSAIGFSSQS